MDDQRAARIPFSQKVAFGIGMLANNLFPAAMSVFMVVLVQGLGMKPLWWGLAAALPRLVDAITDPIMGFITDNTRSRWGRRRPYIFVGAIFAGLSYVFMWQLNPEHSQAFNFWYFLTLAVLFFIGLTIFATPYVAMGYEMSSDFHERTRLMAVSQWIGQWAWVVAPWFWVIIYREDLFENAVAGARQLAIWVGLTCMVLAIVPAIFCRTVDVDPATQEDLTIRNLGRSIAVLARGLLDAFACRPFRQICMATFFVFGSFNTTAGLTFFIIVHHMYGGDAGRAGTWPAWFGCVSSLMTCFLVIPIVTLMSQHLGKRRAFLISQGISIFGYLGFWWFLTPTNPWLMFAPLPFYAFGIGGLFTLMMSMTADVCDLDEWRTGTRREGTFGAVYWWMVKLGLAIAGLSMGLVMDGVGFESEGATESSIIGLRQAYSIIPIAGTLLAIAVMWRYDLSETRSNEIRAQIEARKAGAA
ncbi:MAG: MFS transporter [Phycisphaerales bacterium]|nr:MFS transporter [Phycisphaerales bacterium]